MKRKYDRLIKKYDGSEVEFTFDDERPIQEQMDTKGCRYKKMHQFHVPKLNSSVLETYNWNIVATYDELAESGAIIALGDCQLLETLREETNHPYDYSTMEGLKKMLKYAEKNNNIDKISEITEDIKSQQYIPEYLTIEFDSLSHYKKLFKHEKEYEKGIDNPDTVRIRFNGNSYVRLTCGAAQARKGIVVFCDERYAQNIIDKLDAERNLEKLMAPSKFNAYFGLYSSVSSKVTMPRIAIIGAYETTEKVDTMYESKEEGADFEHDSKLERKLKEEKFNRFDGGGIIRPEMALQWAYDLGLDYVPANFCIRYTFTKGAVACFDFVKWCTEKNDGNYIMKDIFGNEFDVREKDIIITEDMAKMINQWDSVEHYIECSNRADIGMRVTKYAPKVDNTANTFNYQYIQTLDWDNGFPYNWEYFIKTKGYETACNELGIKDDELHNLASKTVKFYDEVINDPVKSKIFLYGKKGDMLEILRGTDWYSKSLLAYPGLFNDSHIKTQLRDNIKGGIEEAKIGHGIERGNYQCLVPDSYAFCEFMAEYDKDKEEYHNVKGLLNKGEYYCAFWNNKTRRDENDKLLPGYVTEVALARSPQTYRSEWVKCKLVNNPEVKKWYMHQYSGIITPIYGSYTLELAGSDFDYDIGYTTDDPTILKKIYNNKPVTSYDVPKPAKVKLTKKALREIDTKSFGQKIGQITNISTVLYCMQTRYNETDEEYKLIESRLQQLCIAQSKQIDKTKIGQAVKSIPREWREEGNNEHKNNIIIPEGVSYKPYFMKYKYKAMEDTYKLWCKEYNHHIDTKKYDKRYGAVNDASKLDWNWYYESKKPNEEVPKEYKDALDALPIYTDPCPMNRWAWYIESECDIKARKANNSVFNYHILMNNNISESIDGAYNTLQYIMKHKIEFVNKSDSLKFSKDAEGNKNICREIYLKTLKHELLKHMELDVLVNCLVLYFYRDRISEAKNLFWELVGEEVYYNILNNIEHVYLPVKDENGSIHYLYDNYTIKKYTVEDIRNETLY